MNSDDAWKGIKGLADEALDAVERAVFGSIGGAERQVQKDRAMTPLDRARAEVEALGMSDETITKARTIRERRADAEAMARAELAVLKAGKTGAPAAGTPLVRSLGGVSSVVEPEPAVTPGPTAPVVALPPEERKRTL